jgi:serine/threonine-protein kinase
MSTPLDRLNTALFERYRVERELGAGGMATVYLAEDVKHRRKVALKVLRPELAAVIGADRFLHEITTTANLHHPHILGLHDSGQVNGTVFYVMPFIPGESLRDRLTREKQLPVDDAVRITREVASALDYAHRQGIIHRDIKPENILLHDGSALVADFGIALAASRTGGTRMTETGMSLGTPHYMSPEQAMGERELGPRSDVYALGCVAYEMLSGEPPFTGPTPQAIVARAITDPPRSLRSQRASVPEHVEAAILQSLEKLPADRFNTAGAFGEALAKTSFTRATTSAPRAVRSRPVPWKPIALGLAVLTGLLAVALGVMSQRPAVRDPGARPPIRFDIAIPDSLEVDGIKLSHDGSRLLVLTSTGPWLYTFADMRLSRLDVAMHRVFTQAVDFSPDGAWIAFVERGTLKVVGSQGGTPRPLADTVRSVRWGDDAYLYIGRRIDKRYRFSRIPESGGPIEDLFVAEDTLTGIYGLPLPGGKSGIVALESPLTFKVDLLLIDLDMKKVRPLANPIETGNPDAYTEGGHLILYARDAMYAVPFDLHRLEFTGTAVPFVQGAPLGVSAAAGMLAYTLTPAAGPALMNRRGVRRELPGAISPSTWTFNTSVSPDGGAFAFWRYQSDGDRWDTYVYRLPSGPLVRVSADSSRRNGRPSWSPDGTHVLFLSQIKEHGTLFRAAADGSAPPERVLTRPGSMDDFSLLPDGKRMVALEAGRGLVLASAETVDSGLTLVDSREQPLRPRVSPDGRWLAYTAVAFGRREVFVRPVAGGSSRWQVSRNGATSALWSRSGRELFFITEDSLYSAQLNPGTAFQVSSVQALFRVPPFSLRAGIDVLPGDSLFVMIATEVDGRERIAVNVNFDETLRTLTAGPGTRR